MKQVLYRSRQHGVTLIELLIVVAIVAILMAVGIPGYRQHMIRVKRTDAKRELLQVAGRLERCFTRTNDYTVADNAGTDCVTLPYTNAEGTYQISGNITAAAFALTATPQGGQANDGACNAFTLNQLGTQGVTGSGTAAGCWGGRAH